MAVQRVGLGRCLTNLSVINGDVDAKPSCYFMLSTMACIMDIVIDGTDTIGSADKADVKDIHDGICSHYHSGLRGFSGRHRWRKDKAEVYSNWLGLIKGDLSDQPWLKTASRSFVYAESGP